MPIRNRADPSGFLDLRSAAALAVLQATDNDPLTLTRLSGSGLQTATRYYLQLSPPQVDQPDHNVRDAP